LRTEAGMPKGCRPFRVCPASGIEAERERLGSREPGPQGTPVESRWVRYALATADKVAMAATLSYSKGGVVYWLRSETLRSEC
jgi:hypothetical protein